MASKVKTWRPVAPPRLAICELVEVDDPPTVPLPVEVAETIRGLLESGIVGTKSTIRTRDAHGLRAFATSEEEWLRRYTAALAWLEDAQE